VIVRRSQEVHETLKKALSRSYRNALRVFLDTESDW
jgi:hypothetical protein